MKHLFLCFYKLQTSFAVELAYGLSKANYKKYLGSTWESLLIPALIPALLLCHVCTAGLLMQSAVSPGLVCRVKHSKMIIFDSVMTRGLWLKKKSSIICILSGEKKKRHIILDYAYFIIKLYKWAIKLHTILPSLCFIDEFYKAFCVPAEHKQHLISPPTTPSIFLINSWSL